MEFLTSMTVPFLACLVLTGIHAYLGLHVIERQVIFVDLALAQIAAVGAAAAMIAGHEPGEPVSYWTSLGFTLLGAAVFSLTRFKKQRIPQEALIGLVFVVAASALIVLLSYTGEGDEHIRHALTGNILLVTPHDVMKMACIYAGVGLFHFVFRRQFLAISRSPEQAAAKYNVRLWDFLFYASFGIVVTSSVAVAGVFLVFAFLVAPASTAVLYCDGTRSRLLFGWIMGVAVSILGIAASYFLDWPTGAAVVCAFGASLVLLIALKSFIIKK